MRKWIIAAAILVVLAIGAFVAARNLDNYLNANRDWLAEQVQKAVGREVGFGNIGVSFARGLGVRIADVRLADDPAFSKRDMVAADSVFVRIRLLPALFGHYEIANVTLQRPAINVVKTDRGLNVTSLGAPEKPGAAQGETPGTAQGEKQAVFAIAYAEIADGDVHYVDWTTKPPVELDVDHIDFSASGIRMDEPISFELAAAALGAKKQNVHAKGEVGPLGSTASENIALDLEVRVEDLSLDALSHAKVLAGALPADLSTEGPFSLEAKVKGTLAAATVDASLDADDARVRYGTLLDKPRKVPLRVSFTGARRAEKLDISDAKLKLDAAEITAKGSVGSGEQTGYELSVDSNVIDLGGLARVMPQLASLGGTVKLDVDVQKSGGAKQPSVGGTVDLSDVSVKREGLPPIEGLTTTVTLAGDSATISSSPFRIDGAPATFSAKVESIADQKVAFSIASAELPLSAIGLGGNEEAATGGETGKLRDVKLDGVYADRRMKLAPLSANVFGGSVDASGSYDTSQKSPALDVKSRLHGIRVEQLLGVLGKSQSGLIQGTANTDLAVRGSGSSWDTMSPTLVGGGQVEVRDGVIKGVNIVDGALSGVTGVPGLSAMVSPSIRQKYPRLFATDDTAFEALTGTIQIADQRISTDSLVIRGADYALQARGSVGFDKTADIAAVLSLSQGLSKDVIAGVSLASSLADDSGRVSIPCRLRGTLPSVRAQPDLDVIAKALQGTAVRGLIGSALGQPEQTQPQQSDEKSGGRKAGGTPSLEDQIQRGLEGLLGR